MLSSGGPFLHEALGRSKAGPAIDTGRYSYLPIKCAHFFSFGRSWSR
jgi:hypothetical protein